MEKKELEKRLLALKLAYHGLGVYAGYGKKSVNKKSPGNPQVAGKLMRRIREAGEELQRKIGANGKEEARLVVKALGKKPELCLDIEKRFSGKEEIKDGDIKWLMVLADKNGIKQQA